MFTLGLYFAVWFPFSVACALSLSTVGRLTLGEFKTPFYFYVHLCALNKREKSRHSITLPPPPPKSIHKTEYTWPLSIGGKHVYRNDINYVTFCSVCSRITTCITRSKVSIYDNKRLYFVWMCGIHSSLYNAHSCFLYACHKLRLSL